MDARYVVTAGEVVGDGRCFPGDAVPRKDAMRNAHDHAVLARPIDASALGDGHEVVGLISWESDTQLATPTDAAKSLRH